MATEMHLWPPCITVCSQLSKEALQPCFPPMAGSPREGCVPSVGTSLSEGPRVPADGPDEPAIRVEPFSPEQGGFSAGEREDVVLSCLAPSNPPSRYVWLHNGSQVHVGQTFVIPAIARAQAGTYTCLAENSHLQTRTQATIVLTVYCK